MYIRALWSSGSSAAAAAAAAFTETALEASSAALLIAARTGGDGDDELSDVFMVGAEVAGGAREACMKRLKHIDPTNCFGSRWHTDTPSDSTWF